MACLVPHFPPGINKYRTWLLWAHLRPTGVAFNNLREEGFKVPPNLMNIASRVYKALLRTFIVA